mmetsp:Transcript_9963/g.21911  ORF Transcript_9963/g.21911 Transcript_9963/m.21911 type:complete len:421 (-) Transcript_9963:206-1468(-)|eukprot:CAMPEP_0206439358 /NCGR_PEP_ID=MMETSP0324_2-20121206/12161_1 /ASSEMBLY_ACC=CAM_ASM_000836 /TAXON_ID=2866 /ORGANISM="Crypthecodinium cohnii, Strain Seligo" /LENGTH=420 /DNA_ID=CAMNT_0053906959 /DNA_START=192 /DNA_END=1454 /DNA_ORIENTATION=+
MGEAQRDNRQHASGSRRSTSEYRWRVPSRYEIRQTIGNGSYGSVCEAYDREEHRLVAVKRVRHMFDDLIDCKRILREVSILARLKHEYVVQLYDVLAPGNAPHFDELYLIMEICDSDLKKLCRTDVTLTPLHINTLLYNLLVGVKYLHSAGIYHRDLKPANCLVNQDCSVKICDFGLSRALGGEMAMHNDIYSSSKAVPKRQLTGHVVTRWYRAPELILLQENYTTAIDLWSVGCIYAELLGMLEGTRCEDRGPLFPGSSCFPLSPDRQHKTDYKYHTRGKHDQLNMIFNLIGTPTEDELALIERDDAKRYIRCFAARQGEGFRAKFPHVEANSVDILEKFLRFNPQERPSVEAALSHPLLHDLRDLGKEVKAQKLVHLDFEREPDLDETLLRKYFWKEMRALNSDGIEPSRDHLRRGGA